MKIAKCLAEKITEEKKQETEAASTLTGTVETEQLVESSDEVEDSSSRGLGYNHFYNYPCAG